MEIGLLPFVKLLKVINAEVFLFKMKLWRKEVNVNIMSNMSNRSADGQAVYAKDFLRYGFRRSRFQTLI